MFEQPTVEVVGFELKELPGEYAKIDIDVLVTNNDKREVVIKDIEYVVDIEGITSEIEFEEIGEEITTDAPLSLTLPLTLKTKDAIKLLSMLDAGEELTYSVIGTFHVAEGIPKLFDLPIDVAGTAYVDVGFESFYKQPTVTVENLTADYEKNGDNYIFDFQVNCKVNNMDTRSVTISEVEYLVDVERIKSITHLYSEAYSENLEIAGNGNVEIELPVKLNLNSSQGATLAQAVDEGNINFIVEGLFNVVKIEGADTDFALPLYITGSVEGGILSGFFEQPTVEVVGYTLLELPNQYAQLEVEVSVTNNDTREAQIADIEYELTIEGIEAEPVQLDINQNITVGTPLVLNLPVTLQTSDAIQLLDKMVAGENLAYVATGTFHIDDPVLEQFDLPLNVSGTATVEAGYEDFYSQPQVTLNDISVVYNDNGSYNFDFDIACTVQNMDSRNVTINEVEYVVNIEGVESNLHLYTDSYTNPLQIAGNGSVDLNLPVTFSLNSSQGEMLAQAIEDGTINYTVEGIFNATNVSGITTDFILPLYLDGSISGNVVSQLFEQPTVEVTGYTLLELPNEYTYLNIDILVTNNDTREAEILDIDYQVDIEGVMSLQHNQTINQTIEVGTPLALTLPLTLVTEEAIELLSILDAGEELNYHVLGTFHVNEPVLNLFDLPIDITGSAFVEIGFEEFFQQPEITVNDMDATYSTSGFPVPVSYTIQMDVNTTIQNLDNHSVIIDEVEYVVYVEGQQSQTHYYSDTYSTNISMSGNSTMELTLPVTLILNSSQGANLVGGLSDGTANYIIEGTFHAIDIEGNSVDILLPLYDEGTAPATVVGP